MSEETGSLRMLEEQRKCRCNWAASFSCIVSVSQVVVLTTAV